MRTGILGILLLVVLLQGVMSQPDLTRIISLNVINGRLGDLLQEISTQGNIEFSYSSKKIDLEQRLSIQKTNASIAEVFEKVEHGECAYGVVPVENSTEGAVTHTVDLLVDSELKVCAQRLLKVSHNLLSDIAMKNIKKVYSHPNVFGQCRDWLLANLPPAQVKEIWMASTTDAVEKALKEKNAAAIASVEAAKVHNIKILKRNIQDIAHNTTRFLVISTPPCAERSSCRRITRRRTTARSIWFYSTCSSKVD